MKKILTALSVLTLASVAGSLTVTVLNTNSQKNDVLNNKTQQDTIYIDKNGKQITTNERDLSNINSKEIVQIGFYKNDQGEIQVVNMPRTIEKVRNQLPSEITSLQFMFIFCETFNQDLSSWDTSNVTNMNWTFHGAISFNQNISNWNVSNVTDMNCMFDNAKVFNQNLSKWNTSNVIDMSYMFTYTSLFNQDLSSWDTSKVKSMNGMFLNAISFNQNISNWDVSNVMKYECFSFESGIDNSKKLPKFKKFLII